MLKPVELLGLGYLNDIFLCLLIGLGVLLFVRSIARRRKRNRQGDASTYYRVSEKEFATHIIILSGCTALIVHFILIQDFLVAFAAALLALIAISWHNRSLEKRKVND